MTASAARLAIQLSCFLMPIDLLPDAAHCHALREIVTFRTDAHGDRRAGATVRARLRRRAMTLCSRRAAGLDPEPRRSVRLPPGLARPALVRDPARGRHPARDLLHAPPAGAARARPRDRRRGRGLAVPCGVVGARLYHVATDCRRSPAISRTSRRAAGRPRDLRRPARRRARSDRRRPRVPCSTHSSLPSHLPGARDPARDPDDAPPARAARLGRGNRGRGRGLGRSERRHRRAALPRRHGLVGFSGDLGQIPRIQEGGLGIYGALLGGALGAVIGARRAGFPLLVILDCAVPGVAFAQALGRFGNYFNQELFGGPTSLPWGLEIDPEHRPAAVPRGADVPPDVPLRVALEPARDGRPAARRAALAPPGRRDTSSRFTSRSIRSGASSWRACASIRRTRSGRCGSTRSWPRSSSRSRSRRSRTCGAGRLSPRPEPEPRPRGAAGSMRRSGRPPPGAGARSRAPCSRRRSSPRTSSCRRRPRHARASRRRRGACRRA